MNRMHIAPLTCTSATSHLVVTFPWETFYHHHRMISSSSFLIISFTLTFHISSYIVHHTLIITQIPSNLRGMNTDYKFAQPLHSHMITFLYQEMKRSGYQEIRTPKCMSASGYIYNFPHLLSETLEQDLEL